MTNMKKMLCIAIAFCSMIGFGEINAMHQQHPQNNDNNFSNQQKQNMVYMANISNSAMVIVGCVGFLSGVIKNNETFSVAGFAAILLGISNFGGKIK